MTYTASTVEPALSFKLFFKVSKSALCLFCLVLDSLSKLEYRGYDSAGIAVFENDAIKTKKTKGTHKYNIS